MELLNFLEPLFLNPLFQFFVYMALIQILVQVFLDRKPAFWIASIATTYFWVKSFEPGYSLKGMDYNLGLFNSLLSDKANFSHKSVFIFERQKEMFIMLFRSA